MRLQNHGPTDEKRKRNATALTPFGSYLPGARHFALHILHAYIVILQTRRPKMTKPNHALHLVVPLTSCRCVAAKNAGTIFFWYVVSL